MSCTRVTLGTDKVLCIHNNVGKIEVEYRQYLVYSILVYLYTHTLVQYIPPFGNLVYSTHTHLYYTLSHSRLCLHTPIHNDLISISITRGKREEKEKKLCLVGNAWYVD